MKIKILMLITPLFLALGGLSHAQVLEMPLAADPETEAPAQSETSPMSESSPETGAPTEVTMPTEMAPTTLPGRGMHMEQVETRFGTPAEKHEAVGEPPITRWVYSGFTVYFEHDIVLHAVTHKN